MWHDVGTLSSPDISWSGTLWRLKPLVVNAWRTSLQLRDFTSPAHDSDNRSDKEVKTTTGVFNIPPASKSSRCVKAQNPQDALSAPASPAAGGQMFRSYNRSSMINHALCRIRLIAEFSNGSSRNERVCD